MGARANWRGRMLKMCEVAGLPVLEPFIRLIVGDEPREQIRGIAQYVLVPLLAMLGFLVLWSATAKIVVTDAARLPSPTSTWQAANQLWDMHRQQKAADAEKKQAKRIQARQLIAQAIATEQQARGKTGPRAEVLLRNADLLKQQALRAANFRPSSAPTFIDQTVNSLWTVFLGFFIATAIAVPLGIACGMNPWINAAMNPFIQLFKPVSPLAWLPLAFIVIMWFYSSYQIDEKMFLRKSQLISAATVALCSLWPTLVNTTLGVASVNKDFLNVARVLNLTRWQQLRNIILPSSLPLMFAGLRISLGVGWMVLIAADMLAQNPGLGKFVWDEFQNGSNLTYARIVVAVLVIGAVGLVLDRFMVLIRNLVTSGNPATV